MTMRYTGRLQMTQVAGAMTALITGMVLVAGLGGQKAEAFPPFAKKEGKPCGYCHVNPAGAGKRTPAGDYYKAHGNSFAGYAATAAPKPAAKPAAKPAKAPAKSAKAATKKAPAKKS